MLRKEEVWMLADFQSATVAPDERELVCRAISGDVIGIHPPAHAR